MKTFFIIIISYSILFSQELIDEYINQVMLGDISLASEKLPEYILDYPNHPGVLYLSALLETDGASAKEKFAQIYKEHKSSKYSDESIIKVSEYYYAAGLYVKSAEWLKKIPKFYSRSEYLDKSIKLFINSLIVSGNVDSAEYYTRVFKKQFPDVELEEIITNIKNDYESEPEESQFVELSKPNISKKTNPVAEEKKSIEKIKKPPKGKNKNIIVKIQDLLDRVKEDITSPINEYTLQIGAFGKKSNARHQKEMLINGGYDARIESVNSNGIILYTVRVGYFASHPEAENYKNEIYSRLAVNSIIIKNE